jgi:hypothetical protein
MEKDQYPFQAFRSKNEKLWGSFFDVHEIESDPRFVVKELRELSLDVPGNVLIERVKKSLELLKKYFEFYLPKTELVIGRSHEGSEPTLFVIQEKIDGKPLNFETNLTLEEIRSLDDFISRMIEMYRNTYNAENDKGKLPEVQLGGSALLLGKSLARPDEERRFYLVDIYPLVELEPVIFTTLLNQWILFLEDQQDRIEGGWRLLKIKSRALLEEAIREIHQQQIA